VTWVIRNMWDIVKCVDLQTPGTLLVEHTNDIQSYLLHLVKDVTWVFRNMWGHRQ
ncbi:hypothetical protein J6590_075849, partial [Homalodisca vitripennis]